MHWLICPEGELEAAYCIQHLSQKNACVSWSGSGKPFLSFFFNINAEMANTESYHSKGSLRTNSVLYTYFIVDVVIDPHQKLSQGRGMPCFLFTEANGSVRETKTKTKSKNQAPMPFCPFFSRHLLYFVGFVYYYLYFGVGIHLALTFRLCFQIQIVPSTYNTDENFLSWILFLLSLSRMSSYKSSGELVDGLSSS